MDREQIWDLEAPTMLALRMQLDFYTMQISLGAISKAEVKRVWQISAREVGEGSPHLETRVRDIMTALLRKLDETFPD